MPGSADAQPPRIDAKPLARVLYPVIVGALLSAVPTLTVLYVQVSNQRFIQLRDRQIGSFADYVRTCNAFMSHLDRTRAAAVAAYRWHTGDADARKANRLPPPDEFVRARDETVRLRMELRFQSDLVNGLYGSNLPVTDLSKTGELPTFPLEFGNPNLPAEQSAEVAKQLTSYADSTLSSLQTLEYHCNKNRDALTAQIVR